MQNMQDFTSYLWSPLFDVDTLKKLFNDPMDAIISLGMLPFTPTGGSASNIFIGESDSGVLAMRLPSQYYELDMGSLLLDPFGHKVEKDPTSLFRVRDFSSLILLRIMNHRLWYNLHRI